MNDLSGIMLDPQVVGGKPCLRDCALSNVPHYLPSTHLLN